MSDGNIRWSHETQQSLSSYSAALFSFVLEENKDIIWHDIDMESYEYDTDSWQIR